MLFLLFQVDEEEMVLADEYRDTIKKTREEVLINIDQKDPEGFLYERSWKGFFKRKILKKLILIILEKILSYLIISEIRR